MLIWHHFFNIHDTCIIIIYIFIIIIFFCRASLYALAGCCRSLCRIGGSGGAQRLPGRCVCPDWGGDAFVETSGTAHTPKAGPEWYKWGLHRNPQGEIVDSVCSNYTWKLWLCSAATCNSKSNILCLSEYTCLFHLHHSYKSPLCAAWLAGSGKVSVEQQIVTYINQVAAFSQKLVSFHSNASCCLSPLVLLVENPTVPITSLVLSVCLCLWNKDSALHCQQIQYMVVLSVS